MHSSFENATDSIEFPELLWRRAELRDLQEAQASNLLKVGILTRAYFVAERRGTGVPEESMYRACVYHDPQHNMYGVRFVAYYADSQGELPDYVIDVPVYESLGDTRQPLMPFDDREADAIASAVSTLEFEREFGTFPDLTPDLTDLIDPTSQQAA